MKAKPKDFLICTYRGVNIFNDGTSSEYPIYHNQLNDQLKFHGLRLTAYKTPSQAKEGIDKLDKELELGLPQELNTK